MILLTSQISCERWLEADFPNNQITTSEVFADVQTADAALAELYGSLWSFSLISGDGMGAIMGTYTDDLKCYYTATTNGILDLYNNQQIATNTIVEKIWSTSYYQIYTANSIIEGVSKSNLPINDKNRIMGEALFVRSLIYFMLAQVYKDIPYTTTTDYSINAHLTKKSYNNLLQILEQDVEKASSLIPEEYKNNERIYPNRSVCQFLLGKIKLYLGKSADAEFIFKNILSSSSYVFQNDILKVFQKTSTHIIWQLKPKNNGDTTKEANLYYFQSAAPSTYSLTQNLVSSFDTNDLRLSNWIATVSFNNQTYYRSYKYKNIASNTTEYSVIFRLEEAYLLLAETLLKQNKTFEAIPYINKTRLRAGLVPINTSISNDMAFIELKKESRKEFFAEHGIRFFNLKRWGDLNDILLPQKQNWKLFHSNFPLPQKELLLNPSINPQNEGY